MTKKKTFFKKFNFIKNSFSKTVFFKFFLFFGLLFNFSCYHTPSQIDPKLSYECKVQELKNFSHTFPSLNEIERNCFLASALLHDSAITPYGHLIEEAMEYLGQNAVSLNTGLTGKIILL